VLAIDHASSAPGSRRERSRSHENTGSIRGACTCAVLLAVANPAGRSPTAYGYVPTSSKENTLDMVSEVAKTLTEGYLAAQPMSVLRSSVSIKGPR